MRSCGLIVKRVCGGNRFETICVGIDSKTKEGSSRCPLRNQCLNAIDRLCTDQIADVHASEAQANLVLLRRELLDDRFQNLTNLDNFFRLDVWLFRHFYCRQQGINTRIDLYEGARSFESCGRFLAQFVHLGTCLQSLSTDQAASASS